MDSTSFKTKISQARPTFTTFDMNAFRAVLFFDAGIGGVLRHAVILPH
jgi:hypothetical protein